MAPKAEGRWRRGLAPLAAAALLALPTARAEGARCSPAKPCLSGMHELSMQLGGIQRRALLYVPPGYHDAVGLPLIVVPQAFGWSAEFNIQHSKLMPLAQQQNFSLVQLDAPGLAINVALDGRANPARPDDVAYTTAVLNEVDRVLCLDARRIFCVGFSRGARFCSRLASERSDIFAAITALSGLRYPRPNNASRPVPVLTFHGTADTVNPYAGGGPPYWQSDMADAVSGWVAFNECKNREVRKVFGHQKVERWTGCRQNAQVIFTTTDGGGHEWPDAQYPLSAYPSEAREANEIIVDFLMAHPLPVPMSTQPEPQERDVAVSATEVPKKPEKPKGMGENVEVPKKKVMGAWQQEPRPFLAALPAKPWAWAPATALLAAGLVGARAVLWHFKTWRGGSARVLTEDEGLLES